MPAYNKLRPLSREWQWTPNEVLPAARMFSSLLQKLIVGQNNAILQQLDYMQSLIFFSRVAFICNVCFLLTWIMRYFPVLKQGQQDHFVSVVLILGVLVG